jgi:hypothetical protein
MPRLDDKTAHFLFTVLFGLLCYFSIGWISLYIGNFKIFVPLDVYFLPSFLVMAFSFYKIVRKEKSFSPLPHLEKNEWIAVVFVITTFFITRFLKMDEMRIWLDEYTQFLYGIQSNGESLLKWSFYEQQPPLDYMLSGFAKTLFGKTPTALKFHVFLFSFLFYLILPFCFRLFTSEIWPRYSVVLLLLLCRPLMVYSMEARPLMLSTFFSLTSLTLLLHNLNSPSRSSYFAALFSCLLYTTTTGLQPQTFLLILCVGLTFVKSGKRGSSFKIGLITFIYNIPVLYYLILLTDKTNQFNTGLFDKLGLLFSMKELTKVSSIIFWDPYLLVIPTFLLGLFYLISIYNEKRVEARSLKLFLFLFPFAYVSLYAVSYYSAISWWFSPRYTLNVFSALSFFLLFGMIEVSGKASTLIRKTHVIIFIALFSFGSFRVLAHPFKWYVESANRSDWRGLYSYLNKKVREGDRVLKFTLTDIGNWQGSLFVGEAFYPNTIVKQATLKNSTFYNGVNIGVFCDKDKDYSASSLGRVYLIHDPTRLSSPVKSINVEGMGFRLEKKFEIMELYSIEVESNAYVTIKKYFDLLLKKYPGAEATTPLLESLFCLEERYGTERGFREYLNQYREIKVKQSWTKSGLYYDKGEELEKRFIYFRKRMEEKWK